MKCTNCGADIYDGIQKCPYCKTLTQSAKTDEKFKDFDFKYMTSPDQVNKIRESVKAGATRRKSSKKKGLGIVDSIEKFLAERRATKRAARRAARRGETPPPAKKSFPKLVRKTKQTPEENPFLRNTEVKDTGDEQLNTYTRVKKNKADAKGKTSSKGKAAKKDAKSKLQDKQLLIRRAVGLTVVAAVLALVIWGIVALIMFLFGGKVVPSYAYAKDNSMYMIYNGKNVEVSKNIINGDYLQRMRVEGNVSADLIAQQENVVHTSKDGKVTYFFENYDPSSDSGTLCFVQNGKAKKTVRISDIVHNSIVMTENGEQVLFLKSADENGGMGALYYWKKGMKEPHKLTTDIDKGTFQFSKKGDWAMYLQNLNRGEMSGDLYAQNLKKLKEEKQKIDSDVCYLYGSDKDGKAHIYAKGYDPTDKSFDVYSINKKGHTIRLGERTTKAPWVRKKQNSLYILGMDDDGKKNTNNLYSVDIHTGKKEKIDSGVNSIFMMSKDEKTLIYDKVYDSKPAIADYYGYVKGKQPVKVAANVVVDWEVVPGIPQIVSSLDCKTILYISEFTAVKGGGTLRMCTLKNGRVTSDEQISENVYSCHITGDGKFVYTSNYSSSRGVFDVYTLNGDDPELLVEEIYPNMFGVSRTGNNIFYISNYNVDGTYGNLERMNVKNGKNEELDAKVVEFTLTSQGDVLVYKNLNPDTKTFDLYLIQEGKDKSVEICKGVRRILSPVDADFNKLLVPNAPETQENAA